MCVDRRDFLRLSAGLAGAAALTAGEIEARAEIDAAQSPESIRQLRPLPGNVAPISDDERRARIERAQRLMVENRIDAIYLESGSSLFYYTGVRWGNSERMFAAVIPARGEVAWVTPKFEEARARELIRFGKDIRAWEEDESPYKVVANIFKDRGIRTGRVGIEERVRFFLFDGIRQEARHLEYTSADPVTAGCRVIKSPAEIALMQRANDITLPAFKAAAATLKEGMTQYEFGANVRAAFSALGSSGSALIGFGQYTAFPHGSIQPQRLKEGDVVLMDGGCAVDGYQSDITRTFVFGKPTGRQREIWNLVRRQMMINGRVLLAKGLMLALVASGCFGSIAPAVASYHANAAASDTPELNDLDSSRSEMRPVIERYVADRGSLFRSYPVESSPARMARFKQFYSDWLALIGKMNFDAMSQDGKVDYVLFKFHVEREQQQLEIQRQSLAEIAPLLPFARTITDLAEARRRMEKLDPPKVAAQLNDLTKQIETSRRAIDAGLRAEPGKVKKAAANRAVSGINSLRNAMRVWFGYYNGYDPLFTWWVDEPYKAVDQALGNYATYLTERVVGLRSSDAGPTMAQAMTQAGGPGRGGQGGGAGGGQRGGGGFGGGGFAGGAGAGGRTASARTGDSSDIIGDPIGRDALMVELASEMIPYTPEELIAIAHKELDWCESEMKKASRELGFGDDWHKALEFVKNKFVEPGKQTDVIKDLALEAIEYLEKNDLLTVPPLARESWRMEMMSPERQLVNPFFTGGEVISVSYPTNTMSHEAKMMSMRGNNPHFSRATVQHELIPGHHLQGYMTARYKTYRGLFSTPFWGEGWALYWELLLWDRGFAKTPEDRIGMLFWRSHRCARIIFSLSFHMEKMTPQQCIDLLVNRVGHEPENAVGEVRRSFAGSYGPLYQAAYLLGGIQLHALHKELVDSGKMTNRAFHDTILKENRMPIEMVRAILTKQKLTRDFKSSWKFYGPVAAQ